MNRWRAILILGACWLGFSMPLQAQYNLEEVGIELGPGFVLLQNRNENAMGPTANVNTFFSHYACGKGYGFHLSGGMAGMFPSAGVGAELLDGIPPGRAGFLIGALDFAALGKLRLHEYHRPREWAVFLGPRLQVPLYMQYQAGNETADLHIATASVNRFWPGMELSMQFRRPIGNKKSWFIHPGAVYFFLPAFESNVAGRVRPLYFFLNLGYAFWDQRG